MATNGAGQDGSDDVSDVADVADVVDGSDGKEEGKDQKGEVEGLAEQMSALARSLQAEDEPLEILAHLVRAAIELVPGTDEGSISVVMGRRDVQSHVPSSDLPQKVDALQSEVNQGPCLDAMFEHQTVTVPDMLSERRWPEFSRKAAALGAASMLSFQLYVEGDNLGALNLYGRTPNAFTVESEQVGLLIASHASIAFADATKLGQMRDALRSRDVIGQAKGILMERYGLTAQNAFIMLTQASSRTNIKLLDVAEHLATTGALPSRRRRT
ncbi:GAF and ANTAR domain-containing protein [Arthrobacter agilis]|uniref:GAF and ANTAR domain-containing protein n=1 Tax=Arthrobacter agilis TaxID=37921 RepID=UPI00278631AB|nr:GAF and ANTAR domain-containing protein [Arthrobacter agilis]MDQ0734773.1 transcriptional regulator with GAF, ATPase, and Fis domain [Arthrobacter agilis]